MSAPLTLIWLRNDLRLADNPALYVGGQQNCLVLVTQDGFANESRGAASRVFLHEALSSFRSALAEQFKAQLIIRAGTFEQALGELSSRVRIDKVLWNRSYEPRQLARDLAIEASLKKREIAIGVCRGGVLFEPWTVANKSGQPFQVFTPFYRTVLRTAAVPEPLPKPAAIQALALADFAYGEPEDLGLLPKQRSWPQRMMQSWRLSEAESLQQLKDFARLSMQNYPENHDLPAVAGTSQLSPALHFGLLSPRTVWQIAKAYPSPGAEAFLRQIIWREFAIYCLFHKPEMDCQPIQQAFRAFPWVEEPSLLRAWQRGQTGYPLVDAGMRELWACGWMHNRVRMIVGSFLVKNLHINWLRGAEWFWDTLVDADLANNSMGWQWVSGCGIDPSPFFRIFNPMIQSQKFDPDGTYIKRWVPELQKLPAAFVHRPWEAPAAVLATAGIQLGRDYPKPIVDFAESRQLALMYYDKIKRSKAGSASL